jgi:hypothetical protein
MPGGDRTGPLGKGPMTGRGMGYCTGVTGFGRFGKSRGRGFGRTCVITGLIGLGVLLISTKRRNS